LEEIDNTLDVPSGFNDIDAFLKFNKKREELLNEKMEEWKKNGGKKIVKENDKNANKILVLIFGFIFVRMS
jgi:peptidyl-tRNA hydrolase